MTKKHYKICPGKAGNIIEFLPRNQWEGYEIVMFSHRRPEGQTKRIRMTCNDCGRKVLSSVMMDEDGQMIFHSIPPHKRKGWWKREKKSRRKAEKLMQKRGG
jgi:formylmethanofuran dehydrogenase subunit E